MLVSKLKVLMELDK